MKTFLFGIRIFLTVSILALLSTAACAASILDGLPLELRPIEGRENKFRKISSIPENEVISSFDASEETGILLVTSSHMTDEYHLWHMDKDGTPMLNIACRSDNLSAVKWLLNHGAELNGVSKDRGYTAIMDAVWRGNEDITKFLIRKGAELNTISKEGQTMLILAVGADKTEIVRMLAENGADPDIQDGMGMSAYGYAQLFKKEEILSILEKYHKEQ